jgi:hypothetical protein
VASTPIVSIKREGDLEWVAEPPGLRYLTCTLCGQPSNTPKDADPVAVRRSFREYKIKYVIVHRTVPDGSYIFESDDVLARIRTYLLETTGLTLVYEDPDLAVYRNPTIKDN